MFSLKNSHKVLYCVQLSEKLIMSKVWFLRSSDELNPSSSHFENGLLLALSSAPNLLPPTISSVYKNNLHVLREGGEREGDQQTGRGGRAGGRTGERASALATYSCKFQNEIVRNNVFTTKIIDEAIAKKFVHTIIAGKVKKDI